MKSVCKTGDVKVYKRIIEEADIAAFKNGIVHPVCSTFALARDIEWATRLFVLDMKDDNEEGIGTMLNIVHKSPALVGQEIEIEASLKSIIKNELVCKYTVKVGGRLVAVGETGQRILKKDNINQIFEQSGSGL